jgi:HK97 family phage major capsid protein
MDELKKALEEMKKGFEDFKAKNEEEIKLIKEGKGHAETKEQLEKMSTNIDDVQSKMKEMQLAMNRSKTTETGGEVGNEENRAEAEKIMQKWMKRGDRAITLEDEKTLKEHFGPEYKSLTAENDPEGGYLVRPEISNEIIKKIFESSPMRELSDGITISTDEWQSLYDDDEPDVGWVGETETRNDTDNAELKMISIPVHEIYAQPKATQKLLDDAAINVEQWHAGKVSRKFAREEATRFILGDGVKKPRGILSYPAGDGFGLVEQINSGGAGTYTGDSFIDLQGALIEDFQANATWLMRRATSTGVRKLKDSQGRYLWSVGGDLNGGPQNFLLGAPVRFAADMPAAAADALSVAYGDFREGYKVVDRIGIRILRDPYTLKGFVKFYTTKRVGGGVQQFQAIKLMKLAA